MNTVKTKQDIKDAADKAAHSAAADKAKGHTKQVIGNVKEKIGHLIGDDALAARGIAEHAEGKKDQIKGEIKDKIEHAKDTVRAGVEVVKEKIDHARGKV